MRTSASQRLPEIAADPQRPAVVASGDTWNPEAVGVTVNQRAPWLHEQLSPTGRWSRSASERRSQ